MKPRKKLSSLATLLGAAMLLLPPASGHADSLQVAAVSPVAPSAARFQAAHFAEPLVPIGPTSASEDNALADAVAAYERRVRADDVSSLIAFLVAHPKSGWVSALQTNIGLSYLHYGYFSRAIEAWRAAWIAGKNATDPNARALVDRAVGELTRLYASLGHTEQLSTLFDEIGDRAVTGSATEAIQVAREQLALVEKDPRHLFICGPVALRALMLAKGAAAEQVDFLQWYRAGRDGTNLAEVARLADKTKLDYRLIYRAPGQHVPVPSIVHWKVGHFAAVVGENNGFLRIEDPVFFGHPHWIAPEALDAEASGYFLAPAGAGEDESWRAVSDPEASTVWGKGPTNGTIPGDAGDPPANGKPPDCPMCSYDIKESSVSLTLSDTPVGYTPPIGPSARVRLTYNQREANQPQNFNFFNISPKWTLNWLSYVTDDPNNAGASVTRYLPGGGAYYYSGYNGTTGRFAAQFDDGSILVRASGGPISYQRQLSNGGVEVYSQSDGSSGYPRNIFLTQVIDPQGNALTLNYDNQQRLSSLTDATGRQTSFTYGVAGRPLLVSQITDPFGRSATLAYDAFGRLSAITDVIGLTSSFTYDANALVNSMTTPYGTTTFAYTAPGTSAPPRFVQVTDPLGYSEREEWLEPASIPDSDPAATVPQGMPVTLTNQYLTYRNSFHWDKDAYIAANCTPSGGCDYAKARNRHFTHVPNTSLKSTALESVKYPLENRAWYAYLGQTTSIDGGIYNDPVATGRVLDDGTTQLRKVSYDAAGYLNVTQVVDPLGRTTSYAYSNGVDLAAISQTTAYGIQTTVAQFTYNSAHRPIIYTDASGQTTEFSYNAAGQLTSQTNPLNQKTQYQYDGSGNLTSTINANGVTAATLTYDGYARVRTYTDSEGWTATYGYDAANRITKVTYPDGTSETYTYDRLDLASRQDRQSRIWRYSHDANRRLTVIADPEGQQTQLAYNREGQLTGLTDPKGFTTLWIYDVQGRLTSKQYADLSTITYAYEATTSRVKSVTDALGQTKQFSYAKDDRIVGINYLNAVNTTPNVTFAFDPYFPRVISRADGTGTAQFSYVPVGSLGALRMQQEAGASANSTISYAYDELSRLITRTVGGSGAESFQFDTLGRLGTHTSDLGSFVLSYLGQTGQVSTRQLASSNLSTNWSYLGNAGDRRLATISNVGLSPSQFSNYAFTTTPENFIASITETSDTAAAYPTALAQTASFNNLNQLTNLSGQALAYDANGNLISDGTHNYSWDAENRLIRVTYPAQPGKQTLRWTRSAHDGRQHVVRRGQFHNNHLHLVQQPTLSGP
jgi:YD repeat-containing protein